MRAIIILLWLLCGVTAAGLGDNSRQSALRDVTLGPISLVRVMSG